MPRTSPKHDDQHTGPGPDTPGQLSRSDPPPDSSTGRPPVVLIVIVALVLAGFIVLHLTGVMGPGMH